MPAPFAGVADLGFTAQYRSQSLFEPLRDVPLLIEGPAVAMRRLTECLQSLRQGGGQAHDWTDPVLLSDEVGVIAFRDRSLGRRVLSDGAQGSLDYILNLVRPVVFPFLQDCARVAHLRLSENIEMRVEGADSTIAGIALRLDQIVQPNGHLLLT